jgi:hypothetical protein
MVFIQNTKKLFILTLLSLIIISCGMQKKTVEYDDFYADIDQPIVFSEGWGTNYNYPVTVDVSTAITSENSNLISYIQSAVNTWNSAIGRTILQLRTGTVTKTGNDFSSLFLPNNEPFNAMYYDQISGGIGGWVNNTGKPSSTIAATIYNFKKNVISKANIRFNRDKYYFGNTATDNTFSGLDVADMQSIALHELGHFLGLGHVASERNSVMYPTIDVGLNNPPTRKSRIIDPSCNDIERIRTIYPGGVSSQ